MSARPLKSDPDLAEVEEFLTKLPGAGPEHLVLIGDDRRLIARTVSGEAIAEGVGWLGKFQGQKNCYFHTNRLRPHVVDRKAKREDVADIRLLHVDIDDLTALGRIEAFPVPPSVVVMSGGGYQCLWFLESISDDITRAESVNRRIAAALGGDNCHNADRLMRIPGTVNVPNAKKRAAGRKPVRAQIVRSLTDFTRRYALAEVEQALGRAQGPTADLGAGQQPIVLCSPEDLDLRLTEFTLGLIQHGDNLERPIGSPSASYRSRSEAVFRVACDLSEAGAPPDLIAGVLLNPANGISASVREKRDPETYARRQAVRALNAVGEGWADQDKHGRPRSTFANTLVALNRLGLSFEFDEFGNRKRVSGYPVQNLISELSDDLCARLRSEILARFGFDPTKQHVQDATHTLCVENPVHPICQYLDGLSWDGVPRADTWLIRYLGAEDSPLNRAFARAVLVAAVHRVRKPGAKFDTILVLEGPQGSGKSQAVELLAGAEYHSDQEILAMDAKAQAEALEGIWIFEICELQGLGKADIDRVKAFASRRVDRVRPAYARFREDHPRQTVFVGTTNDEQYLRDPTGNRRFWPVKTGKIDLEGLRKDRDQLWAEAARLEAAGVSVVLPEELWIQAQAAQAARVEHDPWLERLANLHGTVEGGIERIGTGAVLLALELGIERQTPTTAKRLAPLMRSLGWDGPKPLRIRGVVVRGYERPSSGADSPQIDRSEF